MESLIRSLRFLLITDGSASAGPAERDSLLAAVEAALTGGATAVMVREKGLSTKDLFEFTREVRRMARSAGALTLVNDRADVALAAGADGVHLGWKSLPVERVRAMLGPDRVIGVSTHSCEELLQARGNGADYATFGPVFPTPSKEGQVEVQGLEGLARARREAPGFPLVGLGGIDPGNAAGVFRAGADGVAMIRSVLKARDPREAARRIAEIGNSITDC